MSGDADVWEQSDFIVGMHFAMPESLLIRL